MRLLPMLVSRRMPKQLYARALIIVIAPMILLQSVIAFVFMERHWQTVTQRLSTAVVRDIAAIIDMVETYPTTPGAAEAVRIAQDRLSLKVDIMPPEPLPPATRKPFFSILDQVLSEEIAARIARPFWIDTVGNSDIVEIRILLDNQVLRVFARRNQAYASNSHIFLLWMVGTSLVLLAIAIVFLRNQIRPIQALARAAEAFGRGQKLQEEFRPRGAEEVRRAGTAFIRMRERIERQIEQRTAMLTGVSHDLRTVLTRFRLQLEFASTEEDKAALRKDIEEMQSMLEGYMAFARGDVAEDPAPVNLNEFFARFENEARMRGKVFEFSPANIGEVIVKPNAFARLMANLISNALRHADHVSVSLRRSAKSIQFVIDDNGAGIPADKREEVFRPFYRLDEARNLNESGTGLGLAIARDLARGHGGEIALDDSPLGGLRATVILPQ
ncbi:MAG: HAMP domain-containing protein [Phyllobacteriaceae bacterium]|nr:HAMP domain-containing protein [Phyllobacteriaceae bacterium]